MEGVYEKIWGLKNLEVHPVIIRWIKAFLTNREQCVKIGPNKSLWKRTNRGLPRCTKLGPIPFDILINPLLEDWKGHIKFVDDTSIFEIIPRCFPSLCNPLTNIVHKSTPSHEHKYCLRSERPTMRTARTERFNNFITIKYY